MLMYPESDYDRMMGGIFCECLGGFTACGLLRNPPPIIRLLLARTNVMGLCLKKCQFDQGLVTPTAGI